MDTEQIVVGDHWRIDGPPGQYRAGEKGSKRVRNFPYDFSLMMTDPLAHRYGKNR
jgi:hypothetical protein